MLCNDVDTKKSNLDMNNAIHRKMLPSSPSYGDILRAVIPMRHVLGELGRVERERRSDGGGDGIFFKVLGAHSPTRTFVIDLAAEFSAPNSQ